MHYNSSMQAQLENSPSETAEREEISPEEVLCEGLRRLREQLNKEREFFESLVESRRKQWTSRADIASA